MHSRAASVVDMDSRNAMAANATVHCLTGCAIGEVAGLIIGTAAGMSNTATIALAVALAFLFGYLLSTVPLVQAGLRFGSALSLVFAADTLSITVMEIVDNLVMALVPGAMDAGLVDPLFWGGMMLALTVAFFAALPVNRYLIDRGKGHALHHRHHDMDHSGHDMSAPKRQLNTLYVTFVVVGFLLGGLVASLAGGAGAPTH